MSMPWWKWAQLPSGGSHDDAGAAEVLGDRARHRPEERAVVLRRDVALLVLLRDEVADLRRELMAAAAAVAAMALARFFLLPQSFA